MIYELIEWVVALTLSEKSVENYNGQQGDIWDGNFSISAGKSRYFILVD
ncbi:MAG: DUF2238 domain-containing protein, partial [Bacteroidota bacterium]